MQLTFGVKFIVLAHLFCLRERARVKGSCKNLWRRGKFSYPGRGVNYPGTLIAWQTRSVGLWPLR